MCGWSSGILVLPRAFLIESHATSVTNHYTISTTSLHLTSSSQLYCDTPTNIPSCHCQISTLQWPRTLNRKCRLLAQRRSGTPIVRAATVTHPRLLLPLLLLVSESHHFRTVATCLNAPFQLSANIARLVKQRLTCRSPFARSSGCPNYAAYVLLFTELTSIPVLPCDLPCINSPGSIPMVLPSSPTSATSCCTCQQRVVGSHSK
jgi:hypothetical protein